MPIPTKIVIWWLPHVPTNYLWQQIYDQPFLELLCHYQQPLPLQIQPKAIISWQGWYKSTVPNLENVLTQPMYNLMTRSSQITRPINYSHHDISLMITNQEAKKTSFPKLLTFPTSTSSECFCLLSDRTKGNWDQVQHIYFFNWFSSHSLMQKIHFSFNLVRNQSKQKQKMHN